MHRLRMMTGGFLCALLLAALPAAAADESMPAAFERGHNVLVMLTITKTGGDGAAAPPKVFKLIGQDNSDAAMMADGACRSR